MNFKLLFFLIPIILVFPSFGQSMTTDTFHTKQADTSSVPSWKCGAGPTKTSKDINVLIVVDGKSFQDCSLEHIFFDINIVAEIKVLKGDSAKKYGKAGKNGVVIIVTKKPVEWISAQQLLKEKENAISGSTQNTLIQVNESCFDTSEKLFFQKSYIKNISVANNSEQFYAARKFDSVVTITLENNESTKR
ncbi:MAG TPA: hypothetical protein VGQ53_04820 [Chitinophagaceae bacterium]|nr:hypothetical protein [Chitinophagaceae bacterium]